MKTTNYIFTIILLFVSSLTFSQKFGHLDFQELIEIVPGRDSAEAKFVAYTQEIEKQYQAMENEFNSKYQDFMNSQTQMTDLVKSMKTKELEDLQARIQDFQAKIFSPKQLHLNRTLAALIF